MTGQQTPVQDRDDAPRRGHAGYPAMADCVKLGIGSPVGDAAAGARTPYQDPRPAGPLDVACMQRAYMCSAY
jgi:hypothetical protein